MNGAADPECRSCAGKGSHHGQQCACVEVGLRDALELPLLFHSSGPWDDEKRDRWRKITGHDDATTRAMCAHIRKVLGRFLP